MSKFSASIPGALALLLCSTVVAAPTIINFESPTYALGALAPAGSNEGAPGQNGWFRYVENNVANAAMIISGDNGPGLAGTQCLEFTNNDGNGNPTGIGFRKRIPNLLTDGPLVTWEFDLKFTNPLNGNLSLRLDDQADEAGTRGTGTYFWWGCNFQTLGAWTPNGVADGSGTWVGDIGWGPGEIPGEGINQWHTLRVTVYYGTGTGAAWGQILKVEVIGGPYAGMQITKFESYLKASIDAANTITLWMSANGPNTWRIDNLKASGGPLPSAVPVANAGNDQTVQGSYDYPTMVNVSAAGSSDDGTITQYRWVDYDRTDYNSATRTLYWGTSPTATVPIGPGVHHLRLFVVDNTGLQAYDDVTITVNRPTVHIDDAQTEFSMLFGDRSGTSFSGATPVVNETTTFGLLQEREMGPWDPGPTTGDPYMHFNFDAQGNLYYITWYGAVVSLTPDLQDRWKASYSGGELDVGGVNNNALIVGNRFVYVVGNGDGSGLGKPAVYALNKVSGVQQWVVPLVANLADPNSNIEPNNWRPKVTMYQNRLYIIGSLNSQFDQNVEHYTTQIYVVDCGDDDPAHAGSDVGTLVASTPVILWALGDGGPDRGNAGNVVFVPDISVTEPKYGLYFNQSGGADTYLDMFEVKINSATGVASATWADGTWDDGPYLWRSHVLYSANTGIVYTPSYRDWGTSLYAWQPNAPDGTQLVGFVPNTEGGNHGHRDVSVLDDLGPKTRIHTHGDGGQIWTYTDENGDGTTFSAVKHEYPVTGGEFGQAGALLQATNGHSILITGTRTNPAYVVAMDLDIPPVAGGDTFLAQFDVTFDGAEYPNWGIPDHVCVGSDGTVYVFQAGVDYRYRILRLGGVAAPTGACCMPDESCTVTTAFNCTAIGGLYAGDTVSCAEISCTGACCVGATCVEMAPLACADMGGISAGLGSTCDVTTCAQVETCQQALAVAVPGFACGDTTDATIQNVQSFGCGASAADGPDVWYTVAGTGYNIYATLCDSELYWDSQLAVYTGNCGALVCVTNADDSCGGGGHAEVTWPSEVGTTYYVRVFGWDYQAGDFGPFLLAVSDDRPQIVVCEGDLNCDGEISFGDINPFVLRLSNPAAYAATYPDCPDGNGDINGNGSVGFDDINPFVSLMSSGQGPCQ